MSIIERFQKEASNVEVELAVSLPVFDAEREYIFCYSTGTVDNTSYKVNKIFYVYELNREDDLLVRDAPETMIPHELLLKANGCTITPNIYGKEAMDAEDAYMKYYEKMLSCSKNAMGEGENQPIKAEFRCIFDQLIPESSLRDIYLYFGRYMFNAN